MNIIKNRGDHIAEETIQYRCENHDGERFSQSDPPPHTITMKIRRAIGRKQRRGCIYGGGQRWTWNALPEDTIILAFTLRGEFEFEVEIPKRSWSVFKLCALRRKCDARLWLSTILASGLEKGVGIEETCRFLFATTDSEKTEEIRRFEQAQAEFHREVAA